MFNKRVLISALFAAGMIGAVVAPLPSVAAVDIQLSFGPPANHYERVPEPRPGYVWGPGHWQWNANRERHVWVAGDWQRARPGYAYNAPGWVERGGRWHYQASRWDRDGDAIPNNRDSTPDGRRRSADRDHDGVPDNRDNYPNNPNYR